MGQPQQIQGQLLSHEHVQDARAAERACAGTRLGPRAGSASVTSPDDGGVGTVGVRRAWRPAPPRPRRRPRRRPSCPRWPPASRRSPASRRRPAPRRFTGTSSSSHDDVHVPTARPARSAWRQCRRAWDRGSSGCSGAAASTSAIRWFNGAASLLRSSWRSSSPSRQLMMVMPWSPTVPRHQHHVAGAALRATQVHARRQGSPRRLVLM